MRKIFYIAVFLLISGCTSPQPKFYQPVPIKASDITYPNFKGTVLLQQLLLPAEAARPQITTVGQNDFELKIDEFNRWGAAPEKLFQRVVAQNLNSYLPNGSVELQTPIRKNYRYAVAIEITEMGGKLGKDALLSASYFIKNSMGAVVKSGHLSEKIAITGTYDDFVLAQSRLIGALSAQIASDLAK